MANRVLYLFALAAVAAFVTALQPAFGQGQLSREEQIQLYRSLPPSQQQALIGELQRQLPAAQRDSIINALTGSQTLAPSATDQSAPDVDIAAIAARFLPNQRNPAREMGIIGAGDTLVIEFAVSQDNRGAVALSDEEQAARDEILNRLKNSNPYRLDDAGRLLLPGVPPIELAGLDVDQATARLRAQRELRSFDVTVTLLPLAPVDTDALKPFGYDFLRRPASLLSSTADIPVPVDYVVGPGDTLVVQLRGDPNLNGEYNLPVSRDGTINLPEIGPLNVSAQRFDDVRTLIGNRVTEQLLGVQASTTLGDLRSISVQVLGAVERPGVYTVSSLATMTDALARSGGVSDIGSLRRIERKRGTATLSTLDIYDFLIRGDNSSDVRLQQGDTVFVPTLGDTVAILGEVLRPAIYEINGEQTADDLVALAGGLRPNASPNEAKLERIVPGQGTTVTEVNLSVSGGQIQLRDGDVLRVEPNLDRIAGAVRLDGNVQRPGLHSWFQGMTVSQLLPSPELVKPMSDVNYVLIRRERRANVEIEVLSVDLEAIWDHRPGAEDLELRPRDTVYVFHLETGRKQYVGPIVDELKAQAGPDEPLPIVRIDGAVRADGDYPLEPGMRVSDLLRAGGGLTDAAYARMAELTRYKVVDGEYRQTDLIPIDLEAIQAGQLSADVLLAPYDFLTIREISGWGEQEVVTLRGEFTFPGDYPIRPGETLRSVLERAGGLTESAFAEGSVFTRVDARQREVERRDTLAQRLESDLAAMALSDQGSSDALQTGQSLLKQLRDSKATGRTVIRLDDVIAGRVDTEIEMKGGDVLYVPKRSQEVTVIGEVQYPTSHIYQAGLTRDDYVERSGGFTRRADGKRVYVVRANGEVVVDSRGGWFRRAGTGAEIRPGDTIVAPIEIGKMRPLTLWSSVTQIIYNMAIAAAAINSF